MKLKINSSKLIFSIMLVLAILCLTSCLCLYSDAGIANAADNPQSISVFQGKYDNYTDTDKYLYNTTTNKYIYPDSQYKTKSNIVKSGNAYNLTVSGDDPIVNIVPRELFTVAGEYLYIGKEYGFFVNTRAVSNYLMATVLVFDIKNNVSYEANNGILDFTVMPVFQYRYALIKSNNKQLIVDGTTVNYSISYTNGAIIALPYIKSGNISYGQVEDYFLKDISYDISLLNEQELNEGNGSLYKGNQDLGAYFTYVDYKYTGHYVQNHGEPLSGDKIFNVLSNIANVTLGIVGMIPGVGNAVAAIQFGISMESTINSVVELSSNVKNYLTPKNITVTNGQITASNFYANRDDQLKYYGKLMKNANIIVQQHENKDIWYSNNESASGYFQVGHSALNTEPNYTRVLRNIVLTVVDKQGNEETNNGAYNFGLRDPNYKPLSIDKNNNVYLLPDGVNYFKFKPQYSGNYNIKLNTTDAVELYMNGVKQTLTNNACTIRLTANQEKKFEVRKKGAGCITTINITPSTTLKNLSINPNEQFIVKYHSGANGVKNLSTSNANCKISKIYTVNNGVLTAYNPGGYQFTENRNVSTRFGVGDYYIVLRNAATTAQATNLALIDAPSLGIGNSTQQLGQNLKFFKFKAPAAGNYVLTATGTNFNMGVNVVKSNLTAFNADIGSGIVRLNGLTANQVLYIGIYNGLSKDASVNVGINKYESSYLWKVNGAVCANNTVNLERGSNYNVEFWINNNKKISDYKLIGDAKYHVSVGTGTVSLRYDSAVDGFVSLLAYLNKTNNIVYGNELRIYPKYENKIKLTGSSNGQNYINFKWQTTVSGITAIRYSVNHLKPGVSIPSSVGISGNTGSINVFYYLNLNYQMTEIKITAITINGVTRNYDSPTAKITVECWYGGGTGKSDSPYTIACVRHFNNIYHTSKSGTSNYYEQTADLDFEVKPTRRKVVFYGTYDGNNHKVKSIKFDCYETPAENAIIPIGALFDDNYGIIKNIPYLYCEMYMISNKWIGAHVGIVAGRNRPGAEILNVSVCGNIINTYDFVGTTGSIVGINDGKIKNCDSTALIKAYGDIGGIAGINRNIIDNCEYFEEIYYLQAFGEMNKSAGGIAGYNIGLIKNCRLSGEIRYWNDSTDRYDLKPHIGQIVGFNGNENGSIGRCVNCTATGSVFKKNLHTVKYYKFPSIRTWNQAQYAGNRLVGRQD